jgi:hypothetical protein
VVEVEVEVVLAAVAAAAALLGHIMWTRCLRGPLLPPFSNIFSSSFFVVVWMWWVDRVEYSL